MTFKKISLIIGLLILSIMGVNAVTTITSCGQSTGWLSNEQYLINISTIDNSYGNNWCLLINGNVDNSTFTQVSPKITISKNNDNFILLYFNGNNINMDYNKFYNFNVESLNTNPAYHHIFFYQSKPWITGQYTHNYALHSNITIKGFYAYYLMSVGDNLNSRPNNLYYSNFNNLIVTDTDYFLTSQSNFDTGFTSLSNFQYNNITNSYFELNNDFGFYGTANGQNKVYSYYNIISGSVFIGNHNILFSDVIGANGYNDFTTSLIQGINFTDGNLDGFQDVNNVSGFGYGFKSMAMYVTKNLNNVNYKFLQNAQYSNFFIVANDNAVPINSEYLEISTYPYNIDVRAKFSPLNSTIMRFTNLFGINMNLNSSIKNLFSNQKIIMFDNIGSVFSYSTNFKPLISLTSNNILIENLQFGKISDTNNAHIIANGVSGIIDNINIINNNFTKSDIQYKNFNNHLIKLYVNNLLITNNTFNAYSINNSHEILDIKANAPTSNIITLNIFNSLTTNSNQIFTNNSDAKFYNNYLSRNTTLTDKVGSNLITPTLVPYLHTNGNYYYFNIGNYYQNNTGCVDGNGDGICDGNYTSGTITDTKPLSSYPFNYASHLLTADFIIIPSDYNITIVDLVEGDTANLNSVNDGINFKFSQNSNYIDLSCYYVLDGVGINTQLNPTQNAIYNYTKSGGWTTKTYTFRVECENEIQGYKISDEINFNVIVAGQLNICGNTILENVEQCDDGNSLNGDGCSSTCQFEGNFTQVCGNNVWELGETCDDGNLINGDGCSLTCQVEQAEGSGSGVGIINVTDTQATADNVVAFAGSSLDAIMNFFSPFAIFFVIIVGILAIAVFLGA